VDGTLQALEQSIGGLERFFVAERSRTLYIRVPKAACTTMLWGLLELEGHDPSMMSRSRLPRLSTPDVVVHDMALYPVPTLANVEPSLREEALTSVDWLRVAIVRNPFARLYSAWESKLLIKPPGVNRFDGAPALIESEQGVDVGASFRTFVRMMSEESKRWMAERHFGLQAELVPTAVLGDIELVPTAGISELFGRLSERAGVTVTPRRSNQGLGIDGTTLLDPETAETIVRLYAPDFELTGADPGAYSLGKPVFLDSMALCLLRLATARSERTIQLGRTLQRAQAPRKRTVLRRVARRLARR
jgi:Sulfotransferase family